MKRKTTRQEPVWEQRASQAAKILKVSEAELMRAIRQAIVRKAADSIVEKYLASTIQAAVTSTRSPEGENIEDEETEFERKVHRDKAVLPEDMR